MIIGIIRNGKPLRVLKPGLLLVSVAMLLLSACGDETDSESFTGPNEDSKSAGELKQESGTVLTHIPAGKQRAGDAKKGKRALLNEPIVSCGLPLSALSQLDVETPYVFSDRQGSAGRLPYNLNLITDENGVELAASNCLACHAAPLFGELVIGLGNEFLDFTQNASIPVEQAGALVSGESEILAWEKFADRIAVISTYMQTETIGVNPANNLTFALMAHRDVKSMQWLDKPRLELPPIQVPPVSVPPWWRMKKKHAMFAMGEGRGDHASIMMTAAILCTDSLQDLAQLDKYAPDISAYIKSLEPPAYPFPIDNQLAKEGEVVFEKNCSQCHGTYGDQHTYPNLLVDIDVVGTDPTLVDFAFTAGAAYVDWFNQSPFGDTASAQPGRGYVAPPLDGVWSTAPFLHNGSVPTIRAVLDSATRPRMWHHRDRSSAAKTSYNQIDLGWHFIEPSAQEKDASGAWLYDTNKPGYANHGHYFGDGLEHHERDAVIEYLKTL